MLGADALVLCDLPTGERLIVRQPVEAPRPGPDEPVRIALAPEARALHLFDAETGLRTGDAA